MKIIMLVGEGESSKIVYNYLIKYFEISFVVEDTPLSKVKFILRRYKKLGLTKVFGQIIFMLLNKLSLKRSKGRIQEIKKTNAFNSDDYPVEKLIKVKSINDELVIKNLQEHQPDVVIVNGTRIIGKKVLKCTDSIFINTHVGITPSYRGVHGGYWALVNNDPDHCGVTVHLVDDGIDTGGVIFQQIIKTTEADDFNTYPYLQIGEALPLLKAALENIKKDALEVIDTSNSPSALYSHPTIYSYLKNYIRGVK